MNLPKFDAPGTLIVAEAGADELLRKPYNLITLADVVRRLLSKVESDKAKAKAKGKR